MNSKAKVCRDSFCGGFRIKPIGAKKLQLEVAVVDEFRVVPTNQFKSFLIPYLGYLLVELHEAVGDKSRFLNVHVIQTYSPISTHVRPDLFSFTWC